ncbi:MAG: PDZ domain-containing protein [Planctomycetaceae bacterium]
MRSRCASSVGRFTIAVSVALPPVSQNRRALARVVLVCAALLGAGGAGFAVAEEPPAAAAEDQPISYWIEQLDSNQFLRRQAASQRLLAFGNEAVQPLADITKQGRLELTERAIAVLQSLAIKQSPDDETGAYGALLQLVEQGTGSASLRSRSALESIRREREQQAVVHLAAAGVKLGYREFVIDSRSVNENVVWIDSTWSGDTDALRWLRWISGAAYAVVEGKAVHKDVLDFLVRMPDLRTVVLREATIDSDVFSPLAELSRIDELEFRYIALTPQDVAKISKLPIRGQLGLIGTDLPPEAVTQLQSEMPGLAIVYRHGGFLGVRCNALPATCQIDTVVEGGAAEKAGLEPGDIIEQIDGIPIERFADLQLQVGKHRPGDEIDILFDRRGEKIHVKLTLQRMSAE